MMKRTKMLLWNERDKVDERCVFQRNQLVFNYSPENVFIFCPFI